MHKIFKIIFWEGYKYRFKSLFIATAFLFSCKNNNQEKLNYSTLEKQVLSHYAKKQGNEYNAAIYLLDNIKYHQEVYGEKTTAFTAVIEKYAHDTARLAEELNKLKDNSFQPDSVIKDENALPANELIANTQQALESYDRANWKSSIPFNDFCNYILPYRVGNEPLSPWRDYFLTSFFKDNSRGIYQKNIDTAIKQVHDWLNHNKKNFILKANGDNLNYPELQPEVLDKLSQGSCHELSYISIALLRSLGIPATIEFTPIFLNQNTGHEWAAIILKGGDQSFDLTAPTVNQRDPFYIPAKVYRQAYNPVKGNHFDLMGNCTYLPSFFNNPFVVDATPSFNKTADVTIRSSNLPRNSKVAYLAVFTTSSWIPIGWGKAAGKDVEFKDFGCGGVYLPIAYTDGKPVLLNDPFILNDQGKTHYLKPDLQHLETIKLTRKFPLSPAKAYFIHRMVGGVFQGSNDQNFKQADNLFGVKDNPGEHFSSIKTGDKKYRYIRYLAPPDSHGNIAEIQVFGNDNKKALKGKVMGTAGSYKNDPTTTKEAAFDGNPLTYFDAEQADKVWVGIDLGSAKTISEIRFMARNDMNSVQERDEYELLYWSNGWQSLSKQVASNPYIVFNKVPKNALLWLRDLTTGIEERIFTYNGDKQVWW